MNHHSSFVHEDHLYVFGGIVAKQGEQWHDSNGNFYILNLKTFVWKCKSLEQWHTVKRMIPDPANAKKKIEVEVEESCACEARDQHSSVFDADAAVMYVFGGYVTGDKANDLWSYSLAEGAWTCLNKGDYRENHQNPKAIPAPRVGAKMVQLDSSTLLLHNGHDNDNEKI